MNPLINRIYKTKSISTSKNKRQSELREKTELVPKITKKLEPIDIHARNKSFDKIEQMSMRKKTILPSLNKFENNLPIQGFEKITKQNKTFRRKYLNTSRQTFNFPGEQSFFPTQTLEESKPKIKHTLNIQKSFPKSNTIQVSQNNNKKIGSEEDHLELFEYIKAISLNHDLQQEFCYMNRGQYPYDYKIVEYQDRNRLEYITVSIRGITFYTEGQTEFYTKDVLKRQISLYNQIKKIPFFKNYVIQKTLKIWKDTMLRKRFGIASKSLQVNLFSQDTIIKQFINRLGNVQYQMGCIPFIEAKISKTLQITFFEKFLKQQQQRVIKSVEFYQKNVYKQLINIVQRSLKQFRHQKRITLGQQTTQRKGFLLLDAKKNEMKYTQQATIKQYENKMLKLGKFTDLLRLNATIKLIKNGLKNVINTLESAYNKFYKQHSGTHIPWIKIHMNIDKKGLICDPDYQIITGVVNSYVNNTIKLIRKNYVAFIKKGIFLQFEQEVYDADQYRNFKYYLEQDIEYKELKYHVDEQLLRAYEKVEQFLKSNENIVSIYTKSLLTQDLEYYLENKNLRDYLESYDIQKQILKDVRDQHQLGIFYIDFTQVRIEIIKKFNEKYSIITTNLPSEVIRRSHNLSNKIKKLYDQFKQNPSQIKYYINFIKNFKSKKIEIQSISNLIQELRDLQDMLLKNKIKIGQKAKLQINQVNSFYTALRKRIQEIQRDQQKQRTYFQKQLEHMFPHLKEKCTKLLEQIYENSIVTTHTFDSRKVVEYLESIQQKFTKLTEEKNNFYYYQKQMGTGFNQLIQFDKLETQFHCLLSLWQFKKKYDEIEIELMRKSYKDIDFNLSQSIMYEFQKQVNQGFKQLETIQLLQYFKAIVQNCIDLLMTCTFFCDEDLLQRHHQEIRELLKNDKISSKILFTRQGLELSPIELQQKYNIRSKKREIQAISIKASNQAVLIKNISSIESFWKGTKLEFSNIEDSKDIFILNQNLQVNQKVDDHIIQLHLIGNSKYVDCVKTRVNQQKIVYNYFRNLLDVWLETQKLWQKLSPIIMSQASLKQPHSSYYQFVTLDTNIKRFNKTMHDLVYIKKISDDAYSQQYITTLKYNKIQLQKLKKLLQDFIQFKRSNYGRFYFLTDSQLIKVIQETRRVRDPQSMEPFLSLCFDVDGFIYEKQLINGLKCKNQSIKIRSIFFRGEIQEIFRNVQDALKTSLRSTIKATIPKYKNDPNLSSTWVNQIPSQTLLVVDRIIWTEIAERTISQGNHKGFSQFSSNLIASLVSKLLNSSVNQRLMFTCLLLQNLYFNQVCNNICQTESSPKDFKWIMQPRFYFQEQQVQIKQLNHTLIYGYEYCAPYLHSIYNPTIQKVIVQTFYCMDHKMGLILQGSEGVGKSQLVKQMSRLSGNYFKNFTCSADIQNSAIIKFLKGICITGVWACFDAFTSLSYQSMSLMFQKFSEIMMMRFSEGTIELEGKSINIHKSAMFFMNRNLPDKQILIEKSKETFNQFYVMLPDEKKICQWILLADGFRDWEKLSSKLYGMFCSCRQIFNHKYDFSLTALKRTLNKAIFLRKKDPTKLEQAIIYDAIKKQNYTNIVVSDQIIFDNLFKRYFEYEEQTITNVLLALMLQHPLLELTGIKQKYFQLEQALQTSRSAILVGDRSGKSTLLSIYQQMKQLKSIKIFPLAHDHIWVQSTVEYIKSISQETLLVFDGELTRQWIDLLNASINYSHSIVIVKGQKLSFNQKLKLVFQARSLEFCPPSFITNMKIIYMESKIEPVFQLQNLLNKSQISEENKKIIMQTSLQHLNKNTNIQQVQLFANWIICFITPNIKEKTLIKLIIWILAYILKEDNTFWNKFYVGKFQEIYFSVISEEFIAITSAIQQLIYQQSLGFHQLIVCTKQVAFYKLIINLFHVKQKNVLIKGAPGTFKTSILKYSTKNLSKIMVSATFTTHQSLEMQMEEKLTLIRKGTHSIWSDDKPFIIQVDDIHLADIHITQILRQIIQMKYIRLKANILVRQLEGCSVISTSNKNIHNKTESRFNVFVLDGISNQNIKTICDQMIFSFLRYHNFKRQVVQITTPCISAICLLFQDLQHTHNSNINNMRIVTKTLKYLISLKKNIYIGADDFVSLFTYNFKRYIFSKIPNNELYNQTKQVYENAMKVAFKGAYQEKHYWISKNRKFQKVKLSDIIYEQMKNFTDKILFQEALKYAIKINNEFHMENGHVLFVGMPGSGKKFLTYLSSVLSQRKFLDISNEMVIKGLQFRKCMFSIIKNVIFDCENIVVYQSNISTYINNSKFYQQLTQTAYLPYEFWNIEQKGEIQSQIEARYNQNPKIRHNIYERLSTGLSIVFAFQKNKDLPKLLYQSKLLSCYYCQIKQWSRQAMIYVGERITKTDVQLITTLHQKLSKLIGQQIRHNPSLVIYEKFIETSHTLYQQKQKIYNQKFETYNKVYQKFKQSSEKIKQWQSKIQHLKSDIKVQVIILQKNIIKQQQEKKLLKKNKELNQNQQKILTNTNQEIDKKTKMLDKQLHFIAKLIDKIEIALGNLQRTQFGQIKKLYTSHYILKFALECIAIILEHDPDQLYKLLADPNLWMKIKNCKLQNTSITIKQKLKTKITNNKQFNLQQIEKINVSGKALCEWIYHAVQFWKLYESSQFKKQQLKNLKQIHREAELKVVKLKIDIQQAKKKLEKLELENNESKQKKISSQKELSLISVRLSNSEEIIPFLLKEQQHCKKQIERFKQILEKLNANAILTSFMINYCCSLDFKARKDILEKAKVVASQFKCKFDDKFYQIFMSKEQRYLESRIVENLICLYYCKGIPLIIDPERKSMESIKNQYSNIIFKSYKDQDIQQFLEQHIKEQCTIILLDLEDIDFYYLNSVLKSADRNISNKLFLYSTQVYSKIKQSIISKTIPINWKSSSFEFKGRLLSRIIQINLPELNPKKQNLIKNIIINQLRIQSIKLELFDQLKLRQLMILDDSEFITTLKQSNAIQEQIKLQYNQLIKQQAQILQSQQKFQETASILHIFIETLHQIINHISIDIILSILSKDEDNIIRLGRWILRILQHKQKNLFLLISVFKIRKQYYSLKMISLIFEPIISFTMPKLKKPALCTSLTETAWRQLHGLIQFGSKFEHLIENIIKLPKQWQVWFISTKIELPSVLTSQFNMVQTLLVIKILKPEKLYKFMQKYIEQSFNYDFFMGENQMTDEQFISISNHKYPIIYPNGLSKFHSLLKKFNKENSCQYISVALKHTDQIQIQLNNHATQGGWIALIDCEAINQQTIKYLQKILKGIIDRQQVHKDYQLFIIGNIELPSQYLKILSVELHLENLSIKNTMKELVASEDFSEATKDTNKLRWLLCLVHSIIISKTKFPLSFENEIHIQKKVYSRCSEIIKFVKQKNIQINYQSIAQAFADIYTQQVFSVNDKIHINSIFNAYIDEGISNSSSIYAYPVPESNYIEALDQFPYVDSFEIFGFNINISIAIDFIEIEEMGFEKKKLKNIKEKELRDLEAFNAQKIEYLIKKLPSPIVIHKIDNWMHYSRNIESQKYNKYLSIVSNRLSECLQMTLKDSVQITENFQQFYLCIVNNMLPTEFNKFYNSKKSFSKWIEDFYEKVTFFNNWMTLNQKIFKPSYFLNFNVFLQGVRLFQSQKKHEFSESHHLQFKFLKVFQIKESSIQQGIVFIDLLFDQSKYSIEKKYIEDSLPGTRFTKATVLNVTTSNSKIGLLNICPMNLYASKQRERLIGKIDISSQKNTNWIVKGGCLISL